MANAKEYRSRGARNKVKLSGNDIESIAGLAATLRAAILSTPYSERPICLRDFPHGSCGDATLLLGTWLSEQGWGDFVYISAERGTLAGEIWTHGWAEQDELIVDITAD
jgi:hypothetical protein